MIFRGEPEKNENGFVKQNRKLVDECSVRCCLCPSEHVELFDFSQKSRFWGFGAQIREIEVSDLPGAFRRNLTLRCLKKQPDFACLQNDPSGVRAAVPSPPSPSSRRSPYALYPHVRLQVDCPAWEAILTRLGHHLPMRRGYDRESRGAAVCSMNAAASINFHHRSRAWFSRSTPPRQATGALEVLWRVAQLIATSRPHSAV